MCERVERNKKSKVNGSEPVALYGGVNSSPQEFGGVHLVPFAFTAGHQIGNKRVVHD